MRFVGTIYAIVYILMLVVMFWLPELSYEGYSLSKNSLSELGAQNTPGNWIMNMVLFMLAIVVVLIANKKLRLFWLPLYLLYLFAFCLFLTGIFQHAPIEDVSFSMAEHITHSVLSTITGTAFSMYCFAILFFVKKPIEKASSVLMFCLAVGLSILMFLYSDYKGVFQRVLFILAFGWLLYSLVTFTFYKPKRH